jgi:tetratricopeptide (TPR) repeat protein
MKITTLLLMIFAASFTPSLFAQTKPTAEATGHVAILAQIPEEARKHFVMGTTLFKDAKTAEDLSQVESEFKKAADLAPQWPEARYNLALAREAAGDYSGAMADLKLYQQFKLSDSETRTVQDKIYALEAKAGAAAKKQAEVQEAATLEDQKKRSYQDQIGFLAGTWNLSATSEYNSWEDQAIISITGKNILITKIRSHDAFIKGTIEGDDYSSVKWILTGEQLPDLPIKIIVNKAAHQINWEEPYVRHGKQGALSWDGSAIANIQLSK